MAKDILGLKPAKLWECFYELTQIPRPTGHTKEVEKYIVDFGKSMGLDTKQDEVGNVLITKPASAGMENAPTVILQSHLDMVPQKNSDVQHDFLKDPIDAHIDGKVVRANKTTLGADNGIGAAAAMAVLADNSLKHGKIEALFTIDEEVGMVGAFGLKPGFLTGSILLNLDTEELGELCVGCAGGADVNAEWEYKDVEVAPGDVAYKVSLTGLRGGHSGTEIHLGRGNANRLMCRLLKDAVANYEVRLASIDGGSLRNAIPREAFAVVTVAPEDKEDFLALVKEYETTYRNEYKATENNISLVAVPADMPATLMPEEIQDSVINAVVGCQNGVISVLTDSIFAGTVETSTNLASVKSQPGKLEVKILTRSSSETRKDEICSSLESVFMLAGAKVSIENPYPGWQPNAGSKTLKVMADLYKDMFGEESKVVSVHAGLECGIILSSTPGLDIVSFGPTILNAHSPDEFVEIDTVEPFYNYLLKTLELLK
ncbi:aminoacyl-histidine dipeptidase [Dysgonomonas sp. 25]|uniref:aminoacyl-histidine dipeptidase n=1 Tax=Dysgonomonas sp. 25 TaxID=2302933 RepID=UPI0013D35353|nr:aminoacyl-histidine dipeptidase [Dysgonomonas sp. 25]NDV68972.1 aminoacyl-histidine dipeptidase [Dysgonomonas sp. 25]